MKKSSGRSPRVCIIGGGGTGAALAYDLALRGLRVVLLERGELTSGTTGRHHGQLHCGARYALGDRAIARECMQETLVLRRIVPEAIEYNGGLFVALDEADAALAPAFIEACLESGIPAREIPVARALALEPALNPAIQKAVWTPDGSFDAFRLPLAFFAAAAALGADIRPWHDVVELERAGGRIIAARAIDRSAEQPGETRVEADYFVSAAGAWAGLVGALAGADVPVSPAPGAMLAVRGRLTDHVVSHLHPAGDGDILVPQRGLSIIGTTQRTVDDPDSLLPLEEELSLLYDYGAALVPAFRQAPVHALWCAARPLAGRSGGDARSLSRDFMALDHAALGGPAGFCTLIGGKATVLRAMAEKAADLVCAALGVQADCRTAERRLPSWREYYRRPA